MSPAPVTCPRFSLATRATCRPATQLISPLATQLYCPLATLCISPLAILRTSHQAICPTRTKPAKTGITLAAEIAAKT